MQGDEPKASGPRSARAEAWLTAGIVLVVLGLGAAILVHGFANEASLWRGVDHDRNGHLQGGLDLAVDLHSFHIAGALVDLDRAMIWPPLHDVALATVLLVGGIDHRLGILPSVMSWAACAMFVWFISLRLLDDTLERMTAGVVALVFYLGSPALRLLDSDVMLEGLGSALTAFALYAYILSTEAPGLTGRWRLFAVAMTLLFFEKANYWEMTAVALALAYLVDHWRDLPLSTIAAAWQGAKRLIPRIIRDPLALGFLAVSATVFAIYAHGPLSIDVFGRQVSLYPPENLVTLAYALLFCRLARAWFRHRQLWSRWLGVPGRAVFHWHVLPIALSFLLPKRLSVFLWYIGLNNGPPAAYDLWAHVQLQWAGFAHGFHAAVWLAWLAFALAGLGAVALLRGAPAGRAVAILALVCAIVVLLHPQQQQRFQASWLFSLWICSGIGAAMLVRHLGNRLSIRRRVIAVACPIVLMIVTEVVLPTSPAAYAAAYRSRSGLSDLDLAVAYLPMVKAGEPVAFLGNINRSPFIAWTVEERCQCRAVLDRPWIDLATTRDEARRMVADWVATTNARRIILIDTLALYPAGALPSEQMAGVLDAMKSQTRFVEGSPIAVPSFPAVVSLWTPANAASSP